MKTWRTTFSANKFLAEGGADGEPGREGVAEGYMGLIGKYSRGAVRVFAVFESNQIGNICWREKKREYRK